MSPRRFALLLALTPGIGGRSLSRILTRNALYGREPEEFLRLSEAALKEEYGLNAKPARMLAEHQARLVEDSELAERTLGAQGVTLVTVADAHYPARIEAMDPDPPPALFLYGNTRVLENPTFAVLSSRNAMPAELNLLESLTEEGVLAQQTLVAGHDRPEYQRAAVVPLRWGAPRILVLDRGLFEALGENLREEPFRAARLWRYEFDPHTDLVVSPCRPNSRYFGVNNQVRDRLVACLADRLDFVKIGEGGNMARLARLALKAGRQVRVSDMLPDARQWEALGAGLLPTGPP